MVNLFYSMRGNLRNSVFLLIASLILLNPLQLKADGEIQVTGVVQTKTDSSLTVNSLEIFVNSITLISNNANASIPYDSVKVGSLVIIKVKSTLLGRLEATEIKLITKNINIELSGKITALTSNSLTINGLQIFVDTSTILITQFNTKLNFSDMKVGDDIVVKVTQSAEGQLIAVIIILKPENNRQEIELEGKIQLVSSNSIMVLDVELFVDSSTIIVAHRRGIIHLGDLKVGDKVEVRGYLQQDSSYLAKYIKVESEEYESNELEIEGTISALMASSFIVNAITFTVDSATVIFGHYGSLFSFSDLKVGMEVKVKAILQSDSSYKAIKIILNQYEFEKRIEIAGLIEEINTDNFTLGGYTFNIDDQTLIYNNMKQRLSFGDLKVGMFVMVEAYLQGTTFLASKIKVRENTKKANYTGAIETITETSITVNGLVFSTDQNTEFINANRNSITINDLKIGQIVKIKAVHQSGDQYLALKIIVQRFWRPIVKAEGSIESLTINSLTVMGKNFAVDSSTLVIGHGTGVITFASLTLGLNVEVKGSMNNDGILTAKLIKIYPADQFELYGMIDSITGTSFIVTGITIAVDANTVIFDEFDNIIVFDSLKINQFVEVKYIKTTADENLAVKIEIEKDPKHVQYSGVISAANSATIQLSVPTFKITNNTIFLSSEYVPIHSASIQTGQSVIVWAEQNETGELTAVQVQQVSAELTTVQNENKESLPTTYELKQNYPNPFNPSTEISFSISNTEEVSLEVYNMIGQKVAVLINETMNAGSHSVKFNAFNMASGVYLYKLTAGKFVSIKKMILLK
ncbi:MAG: T9SS type A sorting domain-containing protein [Melioribacteraceae bacterium]|nr:T9SS type A sorting domain-containing protein [Melioribacteraceae bacterium]